MSTSLKNLPKISTKFYSQKEVLSLKFLKREQSIEKPRKYISLRNIFYHQEKQKVNNPKINKDLSILNFLLSKSEKISSIKTSLSDTVPDKFIYDICMINKYDENLDSSLGFISEFDLEENEENNLNESFDSSNNEENLEEQIEIKTQTKLLHACEDKEDNLKLEKEWNDITELLLNKKYQ